MGLAGRIQITLLPSPDGVQEFKAEMSTSPASFDLPQTINVITKSGTNKFHGSTYEYFRNDVLDTRNYFQLPGQTAALRYNQFGATFGGPIKKDKAFFFLIYDGMRSRQPEEDYTTVPTAAELSGNFNYAGAPTIYNFNPQDPYASQPFLNNTIPSNMISSFAKTFNQFIPAPNFVGAGSLAAYNYSTVLSNPYNSDGGSGRLDYAFRAADHLFARYAYSTSFNQSPGLLPLYGTTYPYSGQNLAVEHTHVFNKNLLNALRFGFTTSTIDVDQEGANGTNYDTQLGIQNIAGGSDPLQYGLPTVIITDLGATFGSANSSTPRGGDWKLLQWTDQLTYQHGSHTFEFGGDVQHNMYATINPTASRGEFEFLPYFTGVYGTEGGIGLADYLLGYPLFALGDSGDSYQDLRWTSYEGYAQDDWRVSPRLTLNLGIRYQYITPAGDALNHQSYFNFGCPCVVTAASGQIHNPKNGS
jgi:hypothetical protein